MTTKAKSKLCFVIGPIGEEDSDIRVHADWPLEEIIAPVMQGFPDFQVERADKLPQPGLIDAQIIDRLLNADLVIADLSFLNPNAFYEIGIRHMAQKLIIHMQLAAEKPPFDVSLYRAVKFSLKKPGHLKQARDRLQAQISAVLADGYQVENPVTNARGRIKLEEHATPDQKVLLEQMQGLQERLAMLEFTVAEDARRSSPLTYRVKQGNLFADNDGQAISPMRKMLERYAARIADAEAKPPSDPKKL